MEFVVDALPVELIEMNSTIMCNYIKSLCADRVMVTLGCHRHFKVGNLFAWMEMSAFRGRLTSLRNMFENTQSLE